MNNFKKNFYETLIVNGKTELSVDAKELKQILNSKKSQELKYEYIGNTKNNLPHTPNGYGEKHFEFIVVPKEAHQNDLLKY